MSLVKILIKRNIKTDKDGVAGFFLDIPVLLVIIIGLTLFILTFTNLYFAYVDEVENIEMYNSSVDVHRKIQMYEEILYEYEGETRTGNLCVDKLDDIGNETFEEDITTDTRYDYAVFIDSHQSDHNWTFVNGDEDIPDRTDLNIFSSPVTLVERRDEGQEKYMGELTVVLWKA